MVAARIPRSLVIDHIRDIRQDQSVLPDRELVDRVDGLDGSLRDGCVAVPPVGDSAKRQIQSGSSDGTVEPADIHAVALDIVDSQEDVDLLAVGAPKLYVADPGDALQRLLDPGV